MTTNQDIIIEQLTDALISLKVRNLVTEEEYRRLRETIVAEINYGVEERKINKEQSNWNLSTSLLYR